MKVFITGVAGFLGSHLADLLIDQGHEVAGCDNLVGGDLANINDDARFDGADCLDHAAMKRLTAGVDIVFHCACLAHEGLSVFSPHLITQSVFGASMSVLSASIANGVKRFVYLSSMARYGGRMAPFTEDMVCWPQDPYGIAKLASEDVIRLLGSIHGMDVAVAVPHNIIGPRQKYDDPYRNVAAIMINRMLQGKQPVIYGDGSQRRSFSYVGDVVPALARMGFDPKASGQVINLGPDEGDTSVLELAQMIAGLLSFKLDPIFVADRPQEVSVATCSADKARKLLGYESTTELDDGLRAMVLDINRRGPKPFDYHLDLEIKSERTPKTWTDRLL